MSQDNDPRSGEWASQAGPKPGAPPFGQQSATVYSPDGRYWWNGAQWLPVTPPPPPGYGKSKTTAGLLGIFLGDFGVHKFYLGEPGIGILYLLFFWTFIPGLVGLVEGIIYLTMDDAQFAGKYNSTGGNGSSFPKPPQSGPWSGGC